jgi:hypothetical protein
MEEAREDEEEVTEPLVEAAAAAAEEAELEAGALPPTAVKPLKAPPIE